MSTKTPEQEERIAELQKDLRKTKPLETLSKSEGGKILIDALKEDIISNIESIISNPADTSLQSFITFSVKLKEKIDLARVITRAKSNRKFLEEELKEALAQ